MIKIRGVAAVRTAPHGDARPGCAPVAKSRGPRDTGTLAGVLPFCDACREWEGASPLPISVFSAARIIVSGTTSVVHRLCRHGERPLAVDSLPTFAILPLL